MYCPYNLEKVEKYFKKQQTYLGRYTYEDLARECGVSVKDIIKIFNCIDDVPLGVLKKVFKVVEPVSFIMFD